jgi:hypothetical protein
VQQQNPLSGAWGKALAALLVAVLGLIVITVTVDEKPEGGHKTTVTIKLDGQDADRKADDSLTVQAKPVDQAAAVVVDKGTRSEAPPGASNQQIDQSNQLQDKLANNDQLPIVQPDAAPSQRGCTSKFITSYSSRRGVAPRLFVVHYTVSGNAPGFADVNSITALFARTSFQASSNYVIDRNGNCNYIVRESDKAWTQAGLNPYAISVEIVNRGAGDGPLLDSAGLTKLGTIISDASKRWHFPLARGHVSGCVPTAPGVVMHNDLGPCGGGHFDISPYSLDPIIAAAKRAHGGARAHVTSADQRRCQLVHAYRVRRHQGKPKTKAGTAAFNHRRAVVKSHGGKCVAGKAVKR